MRDLRLHSDGLRLEEADRPVPGEGEVLVRVHAAAITRGELEWPTDRLPAVPSYELSGVVAETGEEVFALTPFAVTALPRTMRWCQRLFWRRSRRV